MLEYFVNLKIFLNSHLDFFPDDLGSVSEEQVEHIHRNMKIMEIGFQGCWNTV